MKFLPILAIALCAGCDDHLAAPVVSESTRKEVNAQIDLETEDYAPKGRYTLFVAPPGAVTDTNQLFKIDTQTGQTWRWRHSFERDKQGGKVQVDGWEETYYLADSEKEFKELEFGFVPDTNTPPKSLETDKPTTRKALP